jgi:hypothetical protein
MISKIQTLTLALALVSVGPVFAAVTAEEAKQLGSTLTPWGAEKAGNAAGTIPAYAGSVKPPASYDPKKPGVRPDPFASEKPLYSIDAKNMAQYADKLSDGTMALMTKYPSYRIDVYPSHRTANYPQWVNDNSIKNATQCKSINNGLGIEGCFGGTPFPIPKSGSEVMWNKLLWLESPSSFGVSQSWLVTPSGENILQAQNNLNVELPYYDQSKTSFAPQDSYFLYRSDALKPARKAGEALTVHDSIDMINIGRRAWQYLPGQRRVKLSPDLAYDTPNPEGGGASNMDDAMLFVGPMDRFDWKLIGKKELYIPYNVFKLKDPAQCPMKTALTPGALNPNCVRWELQRVWVVEATVKPGVRHNYHKRLFYINEDTFIGVADNYDASGKLYRTSQVLSIPRYESVGQDSYSTAVYDFSSGAYTVFGFTTDNGGSYDAPKRDGRFWSPDALSASGIR